MLKDIEIQYGDDYAILSVSPLWWDFTIVENFNRESCEALGIPDGEELDAGRYEAFVKREIIAKHGRKRPYRIILEKENMHE